MLSDADMKAFQEKVYRSTVSLSDIKKLKATIGEHAKKINVSQVR